RAGPGAPARARRASGRSSSATAGPRSAGDGPGGREPRQPRHSPIAPIRQAESGGPPPRRGIAKSKWPMADDRGSGDVGWGSMSGPDFSRGDHQSGMMLLPRLKSGPLILLPARGRIGANGVTPSVLSPQPFPRL